MRRYFVYMLLCADGSYYVGVTNNADKRVHEHNLGVDDSCYTYTRRPVRVVHCSDFRDVLEAIAWEKQLKGWSRAKKRALTNENWNKIHDIVCHERRTRDRRRRSA